MDRVFPAFYLRHENNQNTYYFGMSTKPFDTPILLITFNRPETTCHVIEQIRKVKPSKLYIFSDAPRNGNEGEYELVNTCRYMLDESQINWDCKVERWFSEYNVGKAIAIPSAITWAFETCEKLIVLEDDCLPHPSFFTFSQYMLNKYEENERVMHISGSKWNNETDHRISDHFFSRIAHTCGWATWKRAWNKYDFWMEQLPELKSQNHIQKIFHDPNIAEYWHERFDHASREEKKQTWADQWQYTLFLNYGLACIPNVNLVSNIGIKENGGENQEIAHYFSQTKQWRNNNTEVSLHIDKTYEKYQSQKVVYKKPFVGFRILNWFKALASF